MHQMPRFLDDAPPRLMVYERQNPLDRFLAWWWPSLLAWLPGNIRRPDSSPNRLCFLNFDGEALREAAPTVKNCAEAVIVLPRRMVLVRHLRMPISAKSRFRDAVLAEIERQTPFDPAAVFFDAIANSPDGKDTSFFVAILAVAPTHTVKAAIGAAAGLSTPIVAIDVEGADCLPIGVNLLPAPLRHRHSPHWWRWNMTLALICVLALFGLSVSLLHARQQAVADLQTQFRPLHEQAVETLRRQRMLTGFNTLLSQGIRSEHPSALELLNEISRRLPPDSHLLQLQLAENAISIRGQTANLGAALTELGRSPLWNVPRLAGSRTLPDGHSQEFSLVLGLKQAPSGKTP